jgi:hypothetical protein
MATDGPSSVIMSSGGGSAVEPKEETRHLDNHVELERLKKECSGMINTLKALHDEEQRLREGNHILAQQAVLMGCTAGFDTGAKRGAGRGRVTKRPAPSSASPNESATKKAAVAKPSNNTTATKPSPSPIVIAQGTPSPPKTPLNINIKKGPTNIKEKCEQVLQIINRHGIFTNLTHPARVAEGFVDLTIHMRVIQKKIESNAFASSFDLFKADVHQMFASCLRGSKDGGLFHEVMNELKKSYEFALANID